MACLRAPVCQQHLTLRQELLPKVSSTGIYISGASLRPLRDRVKGSTMSGAALQLTIFHFLHRLRQELLPKVSSTGIYISGASLRPLRDRVKGSTMSGAALQLTLFHFLHTRKLLSPAKARAAFGILLLASLPASLLAPRGRARQSDPAKTPVVVQPGAPGKSSRTLPPSTKATLPPQSQADVEFMQGMIMHHAQAVEMTALIPSHTENKDLRSLGARISSSQSDEIKFMKRWLTVRGESTSMPSSMIANC